MQSKGLCICVCVCTNNSVSIHREMVNTRTGVGQADEIVDFGYEGHVFESSHHPSVSPFDSILLAIYFVNKLNKRLKNMTEYIVSMYLFLT